MSSISTRLKANNLNFSHKEIVAVDTLDSLLYSEKLSHPLFWLYCQGKEIDIIANILKISKCKKVLAIMNGKDSFNLLVDTKSDYSLYIV